MKVLLFFAASHSAFPIKSNNELWKFKIDFPPEQPFPPGERAAHTSASIECKIGNSKRNKVRNQSVEFGVWIIVKIIESLADEIPSE